MTATQTIKQKGSTVYSLHGSLLEACSCGVACPFWIGEDPDGGECYAIVAYHIDTGEISGLDVSGLSPTSTS